MCTGLEGALIPLVLGGVTSAVGGAITSGQQQQNAQNQANAENSVLTDTLNQNKVIGADARSTFDNRLASAQPGATAAQQGQLTAARQNTLTSNMPTISPSSMPGAADAPTVVKTAISKALTEAMDQANAKAGAQARLGGYGDLFFNQGLADQGAKDKIGTDVNFANANDSLIAPMQQLAATGAYTPMSPIGGILQGLGSTIGSAAGAGKLTNASFGVGK
jgi:hypothetical protein